MTTRHFTLPKSPDAALPWLLILLAAGYVAYYWSNPVGLADDTDSYLNFTAIRTASYPVFIDLVTAAFGSLNAVAKAQLIVAASSFAFLGWSLHHSFRSVFLSLTPVLALMLHPRIADMHSVILTESLFISLLCLLAGSLALMTRRPMWYFAAVSALVCGLAITVRPAGISLLIIWPFLLWLIWRRCDTRRIALAVAIIAPIALCLIVENVAWHAYHDSRSRPNVADRHLFAKLLIIESEPQVSDPELARLVAEGRRLTSLGRDLIADAPSHYAQTRLLVDFETRVQWWRELDTEINAIAQQRNADEYDVFAQAGRVTMLRSPVVWIENALTHYSGLWSRAYVTSSTFEEYLAYIENVEPNPLAPNGLSQQGDPLGPIQRLSSRLMAALLLVSTLSVGLTVWQRLRREPVLSLPKGDPDSRLVVAAVCALAIHAHLLLAGLLAVMNARFAVAMSPLLAVSGVLLVSWAIEQVAAMRTGRSKPAGADAR